VACASAKSSSSSVCKRRARCCPRWCRERAEPVGRNGAAQQRPAPVAGGRGGLPASGAARCPAGKGGGVHCVCPKRGSRPPLRVVASVSPRAVRLRRSSAAPRERRSRPVRRERAPPA
jgi:hypothetical protein